MEAAQQPEEHHPRNPRRHRRLRLIPRVDQVGCAVRSRSLPHPKQVLLDALLRRLLRTRPIIERRNFCFVASVPQLKAKTVPPDWLLLGQVRAEDGAIEPGDKFVTRPGAPTIGEDQFQSKFGPLMALRRDGPRTRGEDDALVPAVTQRNILLEPIEKRERWHVFSPDVNEVALALGSGRLQVNELGSCRFQSTHVALAHRQQGQGPLGLNEFGAKAYRLTPFTLGALPVP